MEFVEPVDAFGEFAFLICGDHFYGSQLYSQLADVTLPTGRLAEGSLTAV